MQNALSTPPEPINEPVLSYAPGSPERRAIQAELRRLRSTTVEIPAYIGGKAVHPGDPTPVRVPHDHKHELGTVHQSGTSEVEQAVKAAAEAKAEWAGMDWTDRAAVFLRAADLIAGPWRHTLNAATMLGTRQERAPGRDRRSV